MVPLLPQEKAKLAILLYNSPHLIKMRFHIRYKFELVSASVKVVAGSVDSEVGITVKVIRKESHTALEGHHNSTDGKHLKLTLGKSSLSTLYKALNVKLVKRDVKVNLGKIGLVLKSSGRTEPDGVAKIVYRT